MNKTENFLAHHGILGMKKSKNISKKTKDGKYVVKADGWETDFDDGAGRVKTTMYEVKTNKPVKHSSTDISNEFLKHFSVGDTPMNNTRPTESNKQVTIASASDEEIRLLIQRLRNERDLVDFIRQLRAGSRDRVGSNEDEVESWRYEGVDLNTPIALLYHQASEADFLAHHGILGMKWGVRRWQNEDGTLTERGKKKRAKQQKKIDKLNDKAIINQIKKGYSEDYANFVSYKKLGSKRISNKDLAGVVNRLNMEDQFYQRTTPEQIKYARQYANKLMNRDIGYNMEKMHQRSKRAAGSAAYKGAKAATGWATKRAAKNAAKTAAKTALVVMSDNDISNTENFLAHHGILGMKWGVRRYQNKDGTTTPEGKKRIKRRTSKMAKKDAKRHADAKMFYGKGAGTRRKLLKAEIEKKKKDIPDYEQEFDRNLEEVDFAKSAKKAKRERKTRDAANRARITTKQVLNVTGPLSVAVGMGLYRRNKPQVDAFFRNLGR